MTDQTPPSSDMSARSIGYVEPATVSSEEFEKIRPFMDDRGALEPKDIFGFRMIACSDGADAYYTRQDPETSLANFIADLKGGSSVLGSHLYETFSFGNSYDAEIIDADPSMLQYEPTFYREMDTPELRATKWVVGSYYIPRGIELNGQKTDDLIRAMQAGAVRRSSITFTIGKYVCNIDGKDLLMGWDRLFADDLECEHFPGVRYPDAGWCVAWMKGNQLLETSLVYRNASPSSMLIRKAEALASRGMLKGSELVRLEERLGQRLPRPEHLLIPGADLRQPTGGTDVTKLKDDQLEERTDDEGETTPPADASQQKVEDEEEDRSADPIATLTAASDAVSALVTSAASSLTTEQLTAIAASERALEDALEHVNFEHSVGEDVARQYELRSQAITEALGSDLTVEAIRGLKSRAEMGDALYAELVRDAVAARVSAMGDRANPDAYKALLETSRDVGYVKGEIEAYRSIKASKFTPGRTVTPAALPDRTPAKSAPEKPAEKVDDSNILAPRK